MSGSPGLLEAQPPASPPLALRRVEVIVNPLSGSVGPDDAAAIERLLIDRGLNATVTAPPPEELYAATRAAVDAGPDLLIVLAGDGTARAAASLCGPDGPLVAPLPGGTMNMLPYALYGRTDWRSALTAVLDDGAAARISGGEVDDRRFYVAAILGAPTLWALAREAMRTGRLRLALQKAKHAYHKMFASELKFALDGGEPRKAKALSLMCPVVSPVVDDADRALEADVLNPQGASEAFRLGFRALLSEVGGDWRADPSVDVMRCRRGWASASGHIPALLDGEPAQLHKHVQIRFIPNAFRALVPRPGPPEPAEGDPA